MLLTMIFARGANKGSVPRAPDLLTSDSNDVVLVCLIDGTVHAVDATSGSSRWSATTGVPLVCFLNLLEVQSGLLTDAILTKEKHTWLKF